MEHLATSAKTLNTNALGYVDRPSRIYGVLKRYVDQMDRFEGAPLRGQPLKPEYIKSKQLSVAVPSNISRKQNFQILRAIKYADELSITVNVRRIR